MYVNDRDEINYHGFLKALRLMQDATLWQVADGICSDSEIKRVEDGERQPEKLMRDRISARLGVSSEEYEDYLRPDEHRQWLIRQYILKALERKDLEEAERGIEELEKVRRKNCVQKQFIGTMRYIVAQMQGATDEELLAMLQKTVALTVPKIDFALSGGHLLSEQELNLILEYIALRKCPAKVEDEISWRMEEYEKIVTFIENSYIDTIGRAKLYPRIACYMSKLLLDTDATKEQLARALEICNKAIEYSRKESRLFYFVEVVEYTNVLLAKVKPYAYKKTMKRNQEWLDVFKELYPEHEVSAYMQSFAYFYWESECHSMAEVMEVRRYMFGFTREKLAGDLCSDKTIIRYERLGFSPNMAIARDLLEKMGMCAEYKRARVITSNPETLKLANALAEDVNNYNVEDGEKKITELKEKLNMNISFNQQEIVMMENILKFADGVINKTEFGEYMSEALESTISFENITRKKKKYLTRSELSCMYNLAFDADNDKTQMCREYIVKLCGNILKRDVRAGRMCVYELLVDGVADYLGDVDRFDESAELCEKMLRESLKNRRMFNLTNFTYHNLWNKQAVFKRNNDMLDPQIVRKMLQRCVTLSDINYRPNQVSFFQSKISELRN